MINVYRQAHHTCVYIYIYNTTSGAGGASRGPWLARIDRRAASSLACEWGRKRVVRIQLGSAVAERGAGSIDHRPFRWNNSNANASRRHRGEGKKEPFTRPGPAMVIQPQGEISTRHVSRVSSPFRKFSLPLYPPLSSSSSCEFHLWDVGGFSHIFLLLFFSFSWNRRKMKNILSVLKLRIKVKLEYKNILIICNNSIMKLSF